MSRSLVIDRAPITEDQIGTIEGYRLTVEISEASEMPKEIFVYRAQMMDPFTRLQKAEFEHVAMPSDLEETPINGVTEDSPLLFRLSTLDVLYRDKEELEQHWQDLQVDIQFLVSQLNRLDDDKLTIAVNYTVGSMADCESSSSSSSSSPEPEPSSSSSSEPEPSSSSSPEPEPSSSSSSEPEPSSSSDPWPEGPVALLGGDRS